MGSKIRMLYVRNGKIECLDPLYHGVGRVGKCVNAALFACIMILSKQSRASLQDSVLMYDELDVSNSAEHGTYEW